MTRTDGAAVARECFTAELLRIFRDLQRARGPTGPVLLFVAPNGHPTVAFLCPDSDQVKVILEECNARMSGGVSSEDKSE